MNKLLPGQVVISKSGRDKGRWFLVKDLVDHQFVTLVDGKLRRLVKPKRKKIIHLQTTHYQSDILEDELVNDAKVWKTIQTMQRSKEGSEIG